MHANLAKLHKPSGKNNVLLAKDKQLVRDGETHRRKPSGLKTKHKDGSDAHLWGTSLVPPSPDKRSFGDLQNGKKHRTSIKRAPLPLS